MCSAGIGCGRLMTSVTPWFPIIEEFQESLRLVGTEMRLGVWERHGSGCNTVGCRSNQTGGCDTDVRYWCVYMMRAFGKW